MAIEAVDRRFRRSVAYRSTTRRLSRGFTLLELLIALAIFAVVSVTVYTRSGDVIRQTSDLEEHTLATWLADNEMALLRMSRLNTTDALPTGTDTREVVMAGRNWEVTSRVSDTSHPWLRRIDIEVAAARAPGAKDAAVYRLTGFVGRY